MRRCHIEWKMDSSQQLDGRIWIITALLLRNNGYIIRLNINACPNGFVAEKIVHDDSRVSRRTIFFERIFVESPFGCRGTNSLFEKAGDSFFSVFLNEPHSLFCFRGRQKNVFQAVLTAIFFIPGQRDESIHTPETGINGFSFVLFVDDISKPKGPKNVVNNACLFTLHLRCGESYFKKKLSYVSVVGIEKNVHNQLEQEA